MKSYARANSEEEAQNVAIDVNNWNEDVVEDFAAVLKDEHDLLNDAPNSGGGDCVEPVLFGVLVVQVWWVVQNCL